MDRKLTAENIKDALIKKYEEDCEYYYRKHEEPSFGDWVMEWLTDDY